MKISIVQGLSSSGSNYYWGNEMILQQSLLLPSQIKSLLRDEVIFLPWKDRVQHWTQSGDDGTLKNHVQELQ